MVMCALTGKVELKRNIINSWGTAGGCCKWNKEKQVVGSQIYVRPGIISGLYIIFKCKLQKFCLNSSSLNS